MMNITLCMILKNEAKTVKQAIQAVLPLIDEAIIGIDESTDDNTQEMVYQAFDGSNIHPKVHLFTFQNDFAALRNHFLDMVETNYALVIDGHDILTKDSLAYLLALKRTGNTLYDVFDFNIIQRRPNFGETWFQQPRLFKSNIRYEFAVHNTILHEENRITIPQVKIYHDQPIDRFEARKAQRGIMNIEGLKDKAEFGDPRSMYYLAMVYFEDAQWNEAADWFKKYVKKSKFEAEIYQAYLYLARCYKEQNKMLSYLRTLYTADKYGSLRNEHLIKLGDYYFDNAAYDKALYYYKLASAVKMPILFLNLDSHFYTWLPWYKIATAYLMVNNPDGAMEAIKAGRTYEPELKAWDIIEKRLHEKFTESEKRKNGFIYFTGTFERFLIPIIQELGKDYMIRFEHKFNPEHAAGADVIWCDWADGNAIAVANYKTEAKKVLRIHAYEVFTPYMSAIIFNAFDKIIFIGNHIYEYFENNVTQLPPDVAEVIPNWVDMNEFSIGEGKRGNKIAWAGYMGNKKAPTMLLTLANSFPTYEFHIAAEFQEADIEHLFRTKKPANMFIHSWQNDINAWFADKDYVLNTSPRESQNMVVMEGMAAGLKPLVYDWVGAKDIYGSAYVWNNFEKFAELLFCLTTPNKYRDYIKDLYSKEIILPAIKNLIIDLTS